MRTRHGIGLIAVPMKPLSCRSFRQIAAELKISNGTVAKLVRENAAA